MNLVIFPLGQTSFHFVCTGFLAEVSGVDGATRSFQILSEKLSQLILYKDSQQILNLLPIIFLKMKDSEALPILPIIENF